MFLIETLHQSNANGRLISSSNVVPSPDGQGATSPVGNASKEYMDSNSQSLIVLLVMVSVLIFILTYCLWGTPWCRRRLCPCLSSPDDITLSSGSVTPRTYSSTGAVNNTSRPIRGTPTIILLPHGRMLVVDGSVIAQFRADTQGVDLMELGQSIAWQRQQSTPSILSSDTNSKDALSPILPFTRFSPPSYDSLFGNHLTLQDSVLYDLPPSYSEINFQLQQLNNAISREFNNQNIERNRNYTSEVNLSRMSIPQNRRFHSVDLLESGNNLGANYHTIKIQSDGNICDASGMDYSAIASNGQHRQNRSIVNITVNLSGDSMNQYDLTVNPTQSVPESRAVTSTSTSAPIGTSSASLNIFNENTHSTESTCDASANIQPRNSSSYDALNISSETITVDENNIRESRV